MLHPQQHGRAECRRDRNGGTTTLDTRQLSYALLSGYFTTDATMAYKLCLDALAFGPGESQGWQTGVSPARKVGSLRRGVSAVRARDWWC